jgi:tetratricopeptide (TPR) repeat protein
MERRFPLGLRSFLIAGVMTALTGMVGAIAAEEQRQQPILIPGIQEPDEMRVEPLPTKKTELTAPDRMLGEAMESAGKAGLSALLPALNRIIKMYPDHAVAYVLRLAALCEGNDRAAIVADIDSALKFMGNSRVPKEGFATLPAIKAKLQYANGDYAGAMDSLDRFIRADLAKATEFTNSGDVKPEKTASVCVWTEPDMDALVQRFPNDYRSHMFRGLYFGKFAPLDDGSLKPALENLSKAAQLNPKSALPQLFKAMLLGEHFVFYKRLRRLGWGDAERDKLNAELVGEYAKALALDPNLLPALKGRANANLNLKQFQQAIVDYDRILSLDPQDRGAYHDRGLAKMGLGRDYYGAISDFSSAIKVQPRKLQEHYSYESRADTYMKTRQWDLAIRDLTTAISLQVGGSVLLMNVNQFRAIYPEYKAASDEAITRKLHQTFLPDLTYEGFSERFLTRSAMGSTVIPDLYLKRSDAYLKEGNWHLASIDFRRAINGFPDYADAVDRWREIGQMGDGRGYIDMKTFDDARNDSIKVWIKQARGASEAVGPYELQRFEINCGARQMRTVSLATYDASGNLVGSREGGRWTSIIPDTVGETLYSGACRAN